MIRYATADDLEFLEHHDQHIAPDVLRERVAASKVYVVTDVTGAIVGWLRFGLFWDSIPFVNMLHLLEPHRQKGLGRQLVERWEEDMRGLGHRSVLTSTQVDEEGQHFYRSLGYADCGVLLLTEQPAELFMRKDLRSGIGVSSRPMIDEGRSQSQTQPAVRT